MRLSHRLYYCLKPMLPWHARMMVRRLVARQERAANRDVWPIRESAAREPIDWQGWPENKQFAFILTHDVEGPEGLAQVQLLAELEMELGFRSSFNFVPQGAYSVPPTLRRWLLERGFEVGVHDLEHDGHLFESKRGFSRKAVQINHHLRDWGAAGFRAGFMLRNLEWQHQLDIEYDSSTFDTDPFELQSDGVATIFPYWIPRRGRAGEHDAEAGNGAAEINGVSSDGSAPHASPKKGYVELPYTLPQDSTLFLVLGEPTSEIWLRKTDWVAGNGGMALVNVHPDYIDFSGGNGSKRKYPVSRYADLLRHVSQNHTNRFWNPLPKEVAAWFKTTRDCGALSHESIPLRQPRRSSHHVGLRGKRAAVLLYSEYPADPRPRRAAEAMIEAGMEVDLLCVRSDDELEKENVDGVRVSRLPIKRSRDSKFGYLGKYARFIASSCWFLARNGWRKYDIIHVHNMPDVLVFSTLLSKIAGAKVVLDLHDPMPEVMMTIYGFDERRFAVRLLKLMEKWSIGLADTVITVNEACRKLFSSRSCSIEKITVIMNSPDEVVFNSRDSSPRRDHTTLNEQPFVIMYHGSIVERHGLDIVVEALAQLRKTVPNAELRIYGGENAFLRKVLGSIKDPALKRAVRYLGAKTLDQIVEAIRECDVGVIPNRRSIFTELNTPTRIFEYLSQGKPVIAPRAPGILDYFGAADLEYFNLGDVSDLAEKLRYVATNPDAVAETVKRGQAVYRTHLWSNEKYRFVDAVARTLGLTTSRVDEMDRQIPVPVQVGK